MVWLGCQLGDSPFLLWFLVSFPNLLVIFPIQHLGVHHLHNTRPCREPSRMGWINASMHRCLGLAIHLRKARVDALRLQRNGIPGSEIDQLGKVPTASGKDIKILQHLLVRSPDPFKTFRHTHHGGHSDWITQREISWWTWQNEINGKTLQSLAWFSGWQKFGDSQSACSAKSFSQNEQNRSGFTSTLNLRNHETSVCLAHATTCNSNSSVSPVLDFVQKFALHPIELDIAEHLVETGRKKHSFQSKEKRQFSNCQFSWGPDRKEFCKGAISNRFVLNCNTNHDHQNRHQFHDDLALKLCHRKAQKQLIDIATDYNHHNQRTLSLFP